MKNPAGCRGDNRGPDPTISHYSRAGHLRTGSARPRRNTPHLWGPSSPQHGKAGHRCTEARLYLWPPACLRAGPSYSCHVSGLWCAPSCVPHRAYPGGLKKLQQDWDSKAFWLSAGSPVSVGTAPTAQQGAAANMGLQTWGWALRPSCFSSTWVGLGVARRVLGEAERQEVSWGLHRTPPSLAVWQGAWA